MKIYIVKEWLHFYTPIKNRPFENDEILLLNNGELYIKPGFESDGNTPKFALFGFILIGAYDGEPIRSKISPYYGWPKTVVAFLPHDGIGRYQQEIGVTWKELDTMYRDTINQLNFWPKHIYYYMLRIFGPGGLIRIGKYLK